MEVNQFTIPHKSKSDIFYLIPIGDIHLGNICCNTDKLKELVSWIKDKDNCFWIGMGDYIDCINYTDKRFDPNTVAAPYLADLSNAIPRQTADVIKILAPIKDKCLGLHRGNHEEIIRLNYHYDVMYEMQKQLGALPLNDAAITHLSFKRFREIHSFDIFSTHGNVGGRRAGAKLNRLEDLIGFIDADVYLMGHSHIKATETKSVLYRDKTNNIKCRKRILAVTGAFLEGYRKGSSSYVEKWMYPPSDIGVVKLTFIPYRQDIHISE